jgi:TIR domain
LPLTDPSNENPAPPVRVFIAYAWDDPAYRDKVKSLAARLRNDGIDARLDIWHSDGVSIPEFMSREARQADKILILCSPSYRQKVHAMEEGRHTSGAGWEAMLVNSAIWNGNLPRNHVVIALFRGTWAESAPSFLQGVPYIDLSRDELFESNYLELLRRLTGHVEMVPMVGKVPQGLRPPSTKPLTVPASVRQTAPQVGATSVSSSISAERVEAAISQKSDAEFQIAFEKVMRSPQPEEVRLELEANRSDDYHPFAALDRSRAIRIKGLLLPLLESRIHIESELRLKHRVPYSQERILQLQEKLKALAVDEWVHIVRASYEDSLANVSKYYGQVPDYKRKELEEHRERLLNRDPEEVFHKITDMLRAAEAQLVLDLAQ